MMDEPPDVTALNEYIWARRKHIETAFVSIETADPTLARDLWQLESDEVTVEQELQKAIAIDWPTQVHVFLKEGILGVVLLERLIKIIRRHSKTLKKSKTKAKIRSNKFTKEDRRLLKQLERLLPVETVEQIESDESYAEQSVDDDEDPT